MKKYKLLNAKGLLFTLGTASAVIAPVATLVACGGSSSNNDAEDLAAAHKASQEQIKGLDNEMMFKELAGWSLNTNDIFSSVFNTKKNGIIDVDIWNDNKIKWGVFGSADHGDISSMVDTTVNGEDSKPQNYANGSENGVKSFKVAKKDIITKTTNFETISDEVKDYISNNSGRYLAKVVENKKDSADAKGDFSTGEYTIYLFREKTVTDTILKNAIDIFKDGSKFGIDLEQIKKFGGTYSMGQKHAFSAAGDFGLFVSGFTIIDTAATPKETYLDRTVEDNMKSWTSFGPKITPDQSTIDSLKDIKVTAYPVLNNKTGNFEVTLSVYHTDATTHQTSFNTFTIAAPEITHFSTTKYNIDDLKSGLLQKMNFQYFYSFLHQTLNQKDSLESMPTIKPRVIELATLIPLMAQVKEQLSDNAFIMAIENYANTNFPNLDFNTMTVALNALGNGKFESPRDFGAKTFSILYFIESFYKTVKSFLTTPEGKPFLDKMTPITSADDIYQHQKQVDDAATWAKYLSDNAKYLQNVKMDGLSHDQVSAIVNWNKVLVDAEVAGTLGKFAQEPKVTDFALIPATQHQTDVKAEIALQVHIKDNAKYLAGAATASMTKVEIDSLIAWNKHLEAEQANLGAALVFATKLPTQAEKDAINTTIEWNKMNRDHKAEMDAAAVKAGTTIATATDANKATIIAAAKNELWRVDLQALIDKNHNDFIVKNLSATIKDGDNFAIPDDMVKSRGYADLKAEILKLIQADHQTYSPDARHFAFHSVSADSISIILTFDTKSSDNQIHHNSINLTFYKN